MSLKDKIFTICKEMYGADGVEYTEQAESRIALYTNNGYGNLPICMAKTQYSLSTESAAKGVPTGFTITGKLAIFYIEIQRPACIYLIIVTNLCIVA